MKPREVKRLLLRAAEALQQDNLSFDDKQYLINDLLELAEFWDESDESDLIALLETEPEGALLKIQYKCPRCEFEWVTYWTSACDDTCPSCDLKNITPLSYEEVTRDDEGAEQ